MFYSKKRGEFRIVVADVLARAHSSLQFCYVRAPLGNSRRDAYYPRASHTREPVSVSVGTPFDSEASGSASRALGSALNAGCGKNGACGLRLPLPQDQPVEFGLKPGELLLRGGRLDHPLVLSDVRWADGKPFFDLHKDSMELCMPLTRQKRYTRPLSGWPLFEELKWIRND